MSDRKALQQCAKTSKTTLDKGVERWWRRIERQKCMATTLGNEQDDTWQRSRAMVEAKQKGGAEQWWRQSENEEQSIGEEGRVEAKRAVVRSEARWWRSSGVSNSVWWCRNK